uniref:Receptor expression-enhancing protein n=1 Tax=Rousettus aegyptiacus TaxID=9407 RepID=A0A7J8FLZ2_ROUAE|nr:receptor accessory protein 1 [Rousettus aegyptiacus]
MVSWIISRLVVLIFGTLYPAYYSYKAVKSKDIKEYVKWMMYWIIFALFTTAETFTDIFLCWFPFYYELKIAFVAWLLSPYTKGSRDRVPYRRDSGASACKTSPPLGETVPLLPQAPHRRGLGGPAANMASLRCPGVLLKVLAAQCVPAALPAGPGKAPPRILRSRSRFRKKSTSSSATETT